jgi:hypothetical protein
LRIGQGDLAGHSAGGWVGDGLCAFRLTCNGGAVDVMLNVCAAHDVVSFCKQPLSVECDLNLFEVFTLLSLHLFVKVFTLRSLRL